MNRKVVYNNCYGGFEISLRCFLYMDEHGGLTEKEKKSCLDRINYWANLGKDKYWIAFAKSDTERFWVEKSKAYWTREKFEEELERLRKEGYTCIERTPELIWANVDFFNKLIDLSYFGERHNKVLVDAVETLGSDVCSGPCAKLAITTTYSKAYRITDYDGLESIESVDLDDIYIIDEEDDKDDKV